MVLESNRAMFESNIRSDSNRDWIESRFDFAHHWSWMLLHDLSSRRASTIM